MEKGAESWESLVQPLLSRSSSEEEGEQARTLMAPGVVGLRDLETYNGLSNEEALKRLKDMRAAASPHVAPTLCE